MLMHSTQSTNDLPDDATYSPQLTVDWIMSEGTQPAMGALEFHCNRDRFNSIRLGIH